MSVTARDENVPAEVAEFLNQAGHEALRVDEQGLSGVADPGIAAVCPVEEILICPGRSTTRRLMQPTRCAVR